MVIFIFACLGAGLLLGAVAALLLVVENLRNPSPKQRQQQTALPYVPRQAPPLLVQIPAQQKQRSSWFVGGYVEF